MGIFSRFYKTNFEGGDLILTPNARSIKEEEVEEAIERSPRFVAPKRIDSRSMCLKSSNQQNTPHCTGYSTAGYIEFHNWKINHYPEQVDGDAIYHAAKKLDNHEGRGSWLWAAVNGAINLGFIKGKGAKVNPNRRDVKFALHRFGVCLAGFRITNEWNQVWKKSGKIRNLGKKAKSRGGHAVLLCGYDEEGVYIQNSWGTTWGKQGFAILEWDMFDRQIKSARVIIT